MDELGNISGTGQAKLLRVLQTGEFERLGSSVTRKTRVRVIAATNANLRQMIREGKFREDLFYRLNVIELEVPPLAERRDDILPLAQAFLEKSFSLSPDAERALVTSRLAGQRSRAAERHQARLPALDHTRDQRGDAESAGAPRPRRRTSRSWIATPSKKRSPVRAAS